VLIRRVSFAPPLAGYTTLRCITKPHAKKETSGQLPAIALLGRSDSSPTLVLYAQTLIVDGAHGYRMLLKAAGESFDALTRRDWLRLCEHAAGSSELSLSEIYSHSRDHIFYVVIEFHVFP
jgi:hypothetical protein